MARLKVLFVTSAYPSSDRPTQCSYVREHARAVQMFDDVAVLHCAGFHREPGDTWRIEAETDPEITAGIPTYRVRYRRAALRVTTAMFFLLSIKRAVSRLASEGFLPDVLHANFFHCGVPSVLAARQQRVPLVITEHLTHFSRRILSRADVWQVKFAFSRADLVLPVSEELQKHIQAYGVRARFQVIPNPVDTTRFIIAPEDRHERGRILFVGRLTSNHIKGVPVLLDALARLGRDDWRLDVIGDGAARAMYVQRVTEMGWQDRVTFHGALSSADVASFMRRASFLVLPSKCENLPCVLLEALCCGLPVVATTVGAVPQLVDASRGLLCEPGCPDQLRHQINRMLDEADHFDRAAIARWGREHFSSAVVGERLHRVYEQLLASGGS